MEQGQEQPRVLALGGQLRCLKARPEKPVQQPRAVCVQQLHATHVRQERHVALAQPVMKEQHEDD